MKESCSFSSKYFHCFHLWDFHSPWYVGYWFCCQRQQRESAIGHIPTLSVRVCVCIKVKEYTRRGKEWEERLCVGVFLFALCVCVCARERQRTKDRLCVFVCFGGTVRPGCRYHPSPCHRPKGCWESGRQLLGSDNRGCILIFRHRMLEKLPCFSLTTHYGKPLTLRSDNKARGSARATTGRKSYQLPSPTSRDSE